MKTMTILRMPLILAGFALSPMAASAQVAAADEAAAAEPDSGLKTLADTCSAHKFETMVKIEGRLRGSRVRICGEPGQSDAGWLNTLRSSIKNTEANDSLSQSVKDQIVAALKEEIARLEGLAAIAAPAADMPASPFALSPGSIAPREPAPEYSSLPPLPAPKRAMATPGTAPKLGASRTAEAAPPPEPLVKPRLTIRCALPRENFGSCASLQRESQLMVRADEDLGPGTSLRFLRGGDNRAELDLGPLKKGETLREKLPGKVCSGVLRGKVQVQVVTKNRVADTLGPYGLYCGS